MHGGVQLEIITIPSTYALEAMLAASRDGRLLLAGVLALSVPPVPHPEFPRYSCLPGVPEYHPVLRGIGFIQRLEDGDDAID
jgi:hypothetical protein